MALLEFAQHGLSIVGFILFCIMWSMHLISIIYVRWYMHRRAKQNLPLRYFEGISLLKPLKGIDPNLASNLETFFTLDYEQYEVLLCIQDADDPAVEVCRTLLEKYPNVDAKLCIGGRKVGMNPKINNLMPGYEAAKYNLIWICDSRIRVKADTLTDLTNHMTDKVGMVHGLPYVADREGFAATLEQVYFGTYFTRLYVSAHVTGFTCVAGMSCLMRKEILDQAGGLEAFSQYMGEDYIMAKAIAVRGWKFALATQVAMQNCGSCSFTQFQSRMIRWTKIRINTLPTTLVEPMSECFVASLIIALAAHNVFMWNIVAFFTCHCLAWFIADYTQLSGVHEGVVSKRKYAAAWLIRESLVLPIFLVALWGRATISWREARYRLYCGGKAEEVLDVRERDKRGVACRSKGSICV